MLKFGKGNAKLGKKTATFSLPAGWSCPGAVDCLARADKQKGGIKDGRSAQFRCFAASAEAQYKQTRLARWHNFEALIGAKSVSRMADLIGESLPRNIDTVRIHVSGDFFSRTYVKAWIKVAESRRDLVFYAYTKSLPLFIGLSLPDNLRITASIGGKHDHLIGETGLQSARVVFSEEEASDLGLEIDHDDSHAKDPRGDFALLIHGPQAKGSVASKARQRLKIVSGFSGYSRSAA